MAMNILKGVADYFTPVLTTSNFDEKGVLTPEEFVLAGDQLVYSCRTWQWASGPKHTQKPYLPPDKQYLITRNVPSLKRANAYAMADAAEELVKDETSGGGEEDWLSTHIDQQFGKLNIKDTSSSSSTFSTSSSSASSSFAHSKVIADIDATSSKNTATSKHEIPEEDDGTIPDLDDFESSDNIIQVSEPSDPSSLKSTSIPASSSKSTSSSSSSSAASTSSSSSSLSHDPNTISPLNSSTYLTAEEPEDNIVKTRTYDLSIVYDKFYRTPRVYLFGWDEHRSPLTAAQIMEDISADHANKTVTVDPHPHSEVPAHASIHPCKHASVMKHLVEQLSQNSPEKDKMNVNQYMFLFLKFISSVIPTIEYDFTLSVQ